MTLVSSREELLSGSPLASLAVLDGLLDPGNLVGNASITRSQLRSLLEILESLILLLQTAVGHRAAVVSLGLVGILGVCSSSRFESISSPGLAILELTKLVSKQR